jgi:hypothetical protein
VEVTSIISWAGFSVGCLCPAPPCSPCPLRKSSVNAHNNDVSLVDRSATMDPETKSHFRKIQVIKPDYAVAVITQYESSRTGLRVVAVDRQSPMMIGGFALATEIHDESGAPHTLEHLVFMVWVVLISVLRMLIAYRAPRTTPMPTFSTPSLAEHTLRPMRGPAPTAPTTLLRPPARTASSRSCVARDFLRRQLTTYSYLSILSTSFCQA